MCGIVGAYSLKNQSSSPSEGIAEAMRRMERRGPDGEGLFEGPGVTFGHRRLAIVDLEGGPQPWKDEESGVVLVFNGEIYNHNQLRNELIKLGHSFVSRSDTEVLCHAYLQWGKFCVDYLVGMFAFAVWDPMESGVFVARDRLGVKPLYWSLSSDRFYFASSVSALRALPGISGRLDLHVVSHYLSTVRTSLADRTLLADIKTLQPGHAMWVQQGKLPRCWSYWDIPVSRPQDKASLSLQSAAEQLKALLDVSVRDRLLADVPIGSFLSGGLDSAVITAVAGRHLQDGLNTYSVGFEREGYSEWQYARETADHLNLRNISILAQEEEYQDYWVGLVNDKGLPLSTPNEVGIYQLARALGNDCKVALSGEGADEVFGGYSIPQFSALDYDRSNAGADPRFSAALRRLYGCDRFESRADHFFHLNSWMPQTAKWALFDPDVALRLQQTDRVFAHYQAMLENTEDCSTLDAYLHLHARINLEGLLSRVDSSTMAASVEARVPFTDHRLVEFAFGLPDQLKLDWNGPFAQRIGSHMNVVELANQGFIDSKRALRTAYNRELPETIINRPKMSFPTPFIELFQGPMRDTVSEILLQSPLVGTLFSREAIDVITESGNIAIWPVANLCLWSLAEDGVEV